MLEKVEKVEIDLKQIKTAKRILRDKLLIFLLLNKRKNMNLHHSIMNIKVRRNN